jgi:hypothetical protein
MAPLISELMTLGASELTASLHAHRWFLDRASSTASWRY